MPRTGSRRRRAQRGSLVIEQNEWIIQRLGNCNTSVSSTGIKDHLREVGRENGRRHLNNRPPLALPEQTDCSGVRHTACQAVDDNFMMDSAVVCTWPYKLAKRSRRLSLPSAIKGPALHRTVGTVLA